MAFQCVYYSLFSSVIAWHLSEGDIGVYGIAVLGLFSGGISVIQVPSYGIALCGSPTVCGFSSF